MAGKRKSSSLNFIHLNTDEKAGLCKLLEKEGDDVSLCLAKTKKPGFHYCFDCYEMIKFLFGLEETKAWPPERDGNESRYCYDYKTENCFLIPSTWVQNYTKSNHTTKSTPMSGGIDVKTQPFRSKKGGNYPCYVYLLRMEDNVIYVGEAKDYKIRLEQHKKSPGVELKKHGGFKEEIYHVQVDNRVLAEELEQLLVNILNGAGFSATNGKKLHLNL
jgi:predicted GIY-YIG superfamily endonuclease